MDTAGISEGNIDRTGELQTYMCDLDTYSIQNEMIGK
jgi:hypothetical protein